MEVYAIIVNGTWNDEIFDSYEKADQRTVELRHGVDVCFRKVLVK